MTGAGGNGERSARPDRFDVGQGPLARLFVAVQELDRRERVGLALGAAVLPVLVAAAVAAVGGFAVELLTHAGTYLAAATLFVAYLLLAWAVGRYPRLWADVRGGVDADDAEYDATVRSHVAAMVDRRLVLVVPVALAAVVAYNLALGIPAVVSFEAGRDHPLLLALVNYAFGVVGLPVLVAGPVLLYHHLRLVGTVTNLPLSETAAEDLAPLAQFGSVLAGGTLLVVALFLAQLALLLAGTGSAPTGVPVVLVVVPPFGATVLLGLAVAAAAYVQPRRVLDAALPDGWPLLPLGADALLGDRRVQVALVAVLLVTAGAGWGLFGHRPGPDATTDAPFDAGAHPVDGSYRTTGSTVVEGPNRTYAATWTHVYAPGDPPVALTRWTWGDAGDPRVDRWYQRGNASYRAIAFTDAELYRSYVERENVTRAVDATRTVYTATDDDGDGVETDYPPFSFGALAGLRYERAGTTTYEGREAVRYVPHTGWSVAEEYDPATRETTVKPTARVRSAGGELLVDADTGAVLSADVEATLVAASTWWEALTGEPVEIAVDVRVEPGVDRPAPPPWVAGLRDRQENATEEGGAT